MDELETEAGFLALAHRVGNNLRASYEEHGALPVGIVCLARRYSSMRYEKLTPVTIMDDGSGSKAELDRSFRRAVKETRAYGVIFFTAAWYVNFESLEELLSWRGRDLSEHPKAFEALYLSLEHPAYGKKVWQGLITVDGEKRRVGEFTTFDEVQGPHFNHFLD